MSGGSRCCFGVMALLVQIFLHGELALTLYWIVQYRWNGLGFPFSFMGSEQGEGALDKEWNLHPVMMIAGFIYCMGQGKSLILFHFNYSNRTVQSTISFTKITYRTAKIFHEIQ